MADFDTTHLLKMLRQHTSLPATQGWDDENSLRLLTSVLHGYILPMVKAEWQEHNLSNDTTTYTTPLVYQKREYLLPSRAVAASVRKVVLVGPDGARRPLRLFEVDRQEEWNTKREDLPEGYVLRGGRIYLHPAPSVQAAAGWSVRMQFIMRPARLCLTTACAQVSEAGDGLFAVVDPPAAGLIGATVDVVRGEPPFEALALQVDTVENSSGGGLVTFAFSGGTPDGVQAGDWLCPVGQSPFVQAPAELLEVLATRAAVEQLATIGDTAVAEAKAATLGEQRRDATTLVTPRTGEARLQGNGMRKFRGTSWGGYGWPY